MSDDFRELMRAKGYHCGDAPCNAGATGRCSMATMVEKQSASGSNNPKGLDVWHKDAWEKVIENIKGTAEGQCIFPEQLEYAIKTYKPRRLIEG